MKKSLVLLVLLGGCGLYWGNNGDDVCNEEYGGGEAEPSQGYVDPSTGQCEYYGGGGGYCGACEPCADDAVAKEPAQPDWASCYSACSGLDENSCLSTSGCHADYTVVYTPSGSAQDTFWQCVGLPPYTTVVDGSSCANLDAQDCSDRDDCASDYEQDASGYTKFASCDPEQSDPGCAAVDCGPGYHCDEECYPCDGSGSSMGSNTGSGGMCDDACSPTCVPDQTCASVDCGPGYTCAMECSSGTCYPTCISTGGGPGDCYGQVSCNSAPPQCPANTTPGVANGCYTGYCIPTSQCGPNDPGQCYAQVTCNIAPPSCPMGTLAGVSNGCWSGFCIPTGDCEVPACETITNEQTCESRMDCIPVYNGTDCTCTPSGCTCATETWERCESALMPL